MITSARGLTVSIVAAALITTSLLALLWGASGAGAASTAAAGISAAAGVPTAGSTLTTLPPVTAATGADQCALEMVNSIRANPQAAANLWLAGDLNEGLAPGTLSTAPEPPLNLNAALESAAQGHTGDMLSAGFFGHTGSDGSSPFQRMTAAGYNWTQAGENIAAVSTTGSGGVTAPVVDQLLKNLFVDSGIADRGHRVNLLTPAFQAAGISTQWSASWSPFNGLPAAVTTEDLAANGARPVLTGVAFKGAGSGSFYRPGTGISGVKVKVLTRAATPRVVGTAVTSTTGGFAVSVPAGGCYVVTFTKSRVTQTVTGVAIGTSNIELDYTPTAIVQPIQGSTATSGAIGVDTTFTPTC